MQGEFKESLGLTMQLTIVKLRFTLVFKSGQDNKDSAKLAKNAEEVI